MKGVVWKEEERGVGVVWREEGVHKSYKYTATENGPGSQVQFWPVLVMLQSSLKQSCTTSNVISATITLTDLQYVRRYCGSRHPRLDLVHRYRTVCD